MQLEVKMSVITRVIRQRHGPPVEPVADRLVLDADQRASPHFSAFTEGGHRVRVSLERGAELEDGDVLAADDGFAAVVIAADEDLIVLHPGNGIRDWAVTCYQLGNLHRPLKVLGEDILTPRDAQVEAMLSRLSIPFRAARRPFIGERLGKAAGHHHGDHGNDHGQGDSHGHHP
jgi:urease accessory protein